MQNDLITHVPGFTPPPPPARPAWLPTNGSSMAGLSAVAHRIVINR